jgi:dCTP deaminase
MTLLTRESVLNRMFNGEYSVTHGNIVITPFKDERLQGIQYDLTLGDTFMTFRPEGRNRPIDLRSNAFKDDMVMHVVKDGAYTLEPGRLVLWGTMEWIELPDDVYARLSVRSGAARLGLNQSEATVIAPGFKGNLTLELFAVDRPIILRPGDRVCSLTFEPTQEPTRPYDGPYAGVHGPLASQGDFNLLRKGA